MFKSTSKKPAHAPAFYAQPKYLKGSVARDWWTLLHPPYTMLHLSFVVIGACLVGPVNGVRLGITVLAFFLAVGVGAHALDELHGRPLCTSVPSRHLTEAAVLGLGGAVVLGVVGVIQVSAYLLVFMVAGVGVALAYNLELFRGRLHSDAVFALSWGAFPLLTSYFAQHANLSVPSLFAGLFAALISKTQRQLSTPARDLRRRTSSVEGRQVFTDGSITPITDRTMLAPLERALRSLCWASVTLALALLYLRFSPHV
ncbi:MAG: hypothetical protein JWM55_1447 [Acidimicrobiaceae bacterium]|nr:hypothetical protein [Acidimicrobiaceae bacterium]